MQDPRIFIEHVPYKIYKSVGNKKSKYIYIARNPREVAVSLYKILSTKKPFPNNLLVGFNGTWGQFFDSFIKGETYYGGWFDHVSEWYEHRNDANVLFIWYEELLRDLSGSIIRIAGFLEDLVKDICEKASFEVMKTDKDVKVADFLLLEPSTFFRSGTNRSWEEMFTDEQKAEIDQLMSKYFKKEAELF
uniref:Sulfotransferase domain-containing protein n=1 Tax=Acrobeloides nanus TaxID=290746 RepID=A0A914EKW9_9BILA